MQHCQVSSVIIEALSTGLPPQCPVSNDPVLPAANRKKGREDKANLSNEGHFQEFAHGPWGGMLGNVSPYPKRPCTQIKLGNSIIIVENVKHLIQFLSIQKKFLRVKKIKVYVKVEEWPARRKCLAWDLRTGNQIFLTGTLNMSKALCTQRNYRLPISSSFAPSPTLTRRLGRAG